VSSTVDHTAQPLVSADSVRGWLDQIPEPVAVTGGTGFVGSHLIDTLCTGGLTPRVLVRTPAAPRWIAKRPVEWIAGSLADDEALERLVADAGTVIHMAGVVRAARASDFVAGNREGTARLVAAVRRHAPDARLVHVSSLAAVGPSSTARGVGPDSEPRPVSYYGRSKLAAEREVERIGGDGWWTMVRPPAVYGPRDTDIFQFFRMISAGLVLTPPGDRWITVSYVADVVRATLAAAVGQPAMTHHVGEPEPYHIRQLVSLLAEAGGCRPRVVALPTAMIRIAGMLGSVLWRLGARRAVLTPDKAREMLARHWTARTADSMVALGLTEWVRFPEGARASWEWYRNQGWVG